jgi:hypothetical protein
MVEFLVELRNSNGGQLNKNGNGNYAGSEKSRCR